MENKSCEVSINLKRRERDSSGSVSSTERSPAAKSVKMADVTSGKQQSNQDEFSLKDLYLIIKAVEENTNKLLSKHELLNEQMKEMKKSLSEQAEDLEDLKDSQSFQGKQVEEFKKDYNENKAILYGYIDALERKNEELEQYSREKSLEFHGLPSGDIDDQSLVIAVAEKVNIEIDEEDIDICHRINSKNTVKPILVKFISHKKKAELYYARSKLQEITEPVYGLNGAVRVFINENLTRERGKLFAEVRKKVKQYHWRSCYTIDGKIFVRKEIGGRRFLILKEADMEDLY